jgi:deoxyhypusine synthase
MSPQIPPDSPQDYAAIKRYLEYNYRHFNARSVVEAAAAWVDQLRQGNRMFVTIAGAMSTAELGLTLAEMIRQDKIHGISCTGANLEEDVFNLVAHDSYRRIANWRALTEADELALAAEGLNRVTDTCIPEHEAMRKIERSVLKYWRQAEERGERFLPHEFFYQMLLSGDLAPEYQIDPKNSWLMAAAEKNLPIFVPGWEDSTLGNMFVGCYYKKEVQNLDTVKGGLHYMHRLVSWYQEMTEDRGLGFFQIAGGIAGDFPICVVPLIAQDMAREDIRLWSYFCQISDSTTSFGSYSGAVPNEKITWGKLDGESPKFIIESDATIVAPLIFAYVLAS